MIPSGGVLPLEPGQACLDALRCATFLIQQHPQELKAVLLRTMASSSDTTTAPQGGPVVLPWLEALVSTLQGVVREAGGRDGSRRRRKKRRRRRYQAGEEQECSEEEGEATVRRRDACLMCVWNRDRRADAASVSG